MAEHEYFTHEDDDDDEDRLRIAREAVRGGNQTKGKKEGIPIPPRDFKIKLGAEDSDVFFEKYREAEESLRKDELEKAREAREDALERATKIEVPEADDLVSLVQIIEDQHKPKLTSAKKAFEDAKLEVLKKNGEERVKEFKQAEQIYRQVVEKVFSDRDAQIKAVLEQIEKDKGIDKAESIGGLGLMMQAREDRNTRQLTEKFIFQKKKEEALPDNRVKKYFAKNWRAFKSLPEKWENEIEVDLALVDTDYDSQERWAEKLSPGKWRDFQTSGFMKGARKLDRLGERAWAISGPTFRRPLTFAGVVGGAVLLGLGYLTKKAFGPAWEKFKELANEFTLGQFSKDDSKGDGGKKKSGGH